MTKTEEAIEILNDSIKIIGETLIIMSENQKRIVEELSKLEKRVNG